MIIDYEATNVDALFRNAQGCAGNVKMADDGEYEEFLRAMGEIQENKKRKWEKMKMEKKPRTTITTI